MNQLITNRKMLAVFVVVIFALSVLLVALPVRADAPTVNTGYLSSASLKGGVRFRNFNSQRGGGFMYLGKPNLGTAGNRVEASFYSGGSYNYGPSVNHIKFTYNPALAPSLQVDISASQTFTLTYALGDVGTLNYLQLDVVARTPDTTVSFNDVTLNTHSLGSFTAAGWSTWYVTGLDFTSGFTVEGDLVLTGTQPGGENNKLEIDVGALPQYTITASAGLGGSISPSGAVSVNYGADQAFTITADTGYQIADVLVDGVSVSAVPSYTFTAVTADHTITASFISPNAIKSNVLAELQALRADPLTTKEDGKKLDEVIKHLTKSLESELWVGETRLDPKHGEKVFQEEKDAVVKLLELIKDKKSTIPDATLEGFINRLVSADKLLASTAISDAAGGDAKKIDKANDELSKGDARAEDGKFVDAIEHYRNAWNHAVKAV